MIYQSSTEQITLHEFAEIISKTYQWSEELLHQISVIKNCTGSKRNKEIKVLENQILIHVQNPRNNQIIKDRALHSQQEFKERVLILFPFLTSNEIEICCYLKLKLKNETIAALKGVDTSSISMAKYRIKKRLQLETKNNLDRYLSTI